MNQQVEGIGRMVRRTCAFCGDSFLTRRSDAKFCSTKCRQRQARWRVKLNTRRERLRVLVNDIAEYMFYHDAKPAAAEYLKATIRQIEAEFVVHDVRDIA